MSYRAKVHYQDADVVSKYDAERFKSLKGRLVDRREKQLVLRSLASAGLTPLASVLDIPSGTGRLTFALANAGYEPMGADVSPAMVAFAAKRAVVLALPRQAQFVVGDAERLPFPDASFDAVICLRLFGHLEPAIRGVALREIRRVTRRLAIVAYYERRSLQGLLRRSARRTIPWHPVSSAEIRSELHSAGLHETSRHHLLRAISETVVVTAERDR